MSKRSCMGLCALGLLVAVAEGTWAAAPTDLAIRLRAGSLREGVAGIYTLTVINVGNARTDDTVTVIATLPDGLSFVSSRGGGWACTVSGQSVLCASTGPRPIGPSSVQLVVRPLPGAPRVLTSTFTVNYSADTDPSNNTVSETSTVRSAALHPTVRRTAPARRPRPATPAPVPQPGGDAARADLVLTKTIGATGFRVGGVGSYILRVRNAGPASTDAPFTVTDVLPPGLAFVSADGFGWTCALSGATVSCVHSDALSVGAFSSITLRVTVHDEAYPTVTNNATLAYAGDTDVSNNVGRRPTTIRPGTPPTVEPSATPTPTTVGIQTGTPTPSPTGTPEQTALADLLLIASRASSFTVGQTGSYSIRISNLGPQSTNDAMIVTDVLPRGLSFVSASGTDWTCTATQQTVTCVNRDPVAAGSAVDVRLTFSVGLEAVPTVTNTLTLDYPGDTNLTNNSAHVPTPVRR
jgi:uncharacterized repeat protein (TIGR01451 family)